MRNIVTNKFTPHKQTSL